MNSLRNTVSKCLLVLLFMSGLAFADPIKSITDPRMDWYKDAKLGLMITWGKYAVAEGCWSEGQEE